VPKKRRLPCTIAVLLRGTLPTVVGSEFGKPGRDRSAGEIIDKGGKLLIEILQMPSRPAVLSFGLK